MMRFGLKNITIRNHVEKIHLNEMGCARTYFRRGDISRVGWIGFSFFREAVIKAMMFNYLL